MVGLGLAAAEVAAAAVVAAEVAAVQDLGRDLGQDLGRAAAVDSGQTEDLEVEANGKGRS